MTQASKNVGVKSTLAAIMTDTNMLQGILLTSLSTIGLALIIYWLRRANTRLAAAIEVLRQKYRFHVLQSPLAAEWREIYNQEFLSDSGLTSEMIIQLRTKTPRVILQGKIGGFKGLVVNFVYSRISHYIFTDLLKASFDFYIASSSHAEDPFVAWPRLNYNTPEVETWLTSTPEELKTHAEKLNAIAGKAVKTGLRITYKAGRLSAIQSGYISGQYLHEYLDTMVNLSQYLNQSYANQS